MIRRTPLKRKSPLKPQSVKKKKPKTLKSKLIEQLDAEFSKYIRLKYSDSNGYCRCISCGKIVFWKEIQNGHYMSRRYFSTRWSEDNCRPQCVACNMFNQGNIQMYRRGLIKEIGEQRVDLVEALARQSTCKKSEFEYAELIKHYKKEVIALLKEKGLTI